VLVRVANGEVIWCTHELIDCPVWVNGYAFKLTLKILPLLSYDIIFGIDWLERHSPMEIDWKDKWLSFDYQNERVKLQGIVHENVHCELISKKE
jgi:hypothetical protein